MEENNAYDANTLDEQKVQPKSENTYDEKLSKDISQIKDDMSYLRDLFVRRLNEDKQKAMIIKKLAEGATFAYIEPFLYDLILLLDRLEKKQGDDFVDSVIEELYSIINRRGVNRITNIEEFNPSLHKAVTVIESPDVEGMQITRVIRNGYEFSGKIIRPVEVEITKPPKGMEGK